MSLNSKNIIVVGDGYTDLEIKQNGEAAVFIAFTENISRDSVVLWDRLCHWVSEGNLFLL